MKKNKKNYWITGLFGIPIIFSVVLIGLYLIDYKPEFEEEDFGEMIYESKRYSKSSKDDWHVINFSVFTIETPVEYHYFLMEGLHGGKVGGITNSKDTLDFEFGNYYSDACEGIVVRQVIGTCDTLNVFKNDDMETIFVRTDDNFCAYMKIDENGNILKIRAKLTFNRQLIEQIYQSIRVRKAIRNII